MSTYSTQTLQPHQINKHMYYIFSSWFKKQNVPGAKADNHGFLALNGSLTFYDSDMFNLSFLLLMLSISIPGSFSNGCC